jgi:hypothetical protein
VPPPVGRSATRIGVFARMRSNAIEFRDFFRENRGTRAHGVKFYSKTEVPTLLTDAEFDALLSARKERERLARQWDRWDVSGTMLNKPASDGRPESIIEQKFPHIAARIMAFWRTHALSDYIASILVMDRQDRQGFPREVVEDLLMLHALNERVIRMGSFDLSARKPQK